MGFAELFILAAGLSMDAFAVSVCKGLLLGRIKVKHMCAAGIWFGGFQALMPLAGYFLGSLFAETITKYAHWIVFILLLYLGENMIKGANAEGDCQVDSAMDMKNMFLLAIATSIDALAVGVTFAFLKVSIVPAASFIGCVAFVCSAAGVKVGSIFGARYKSRTELCGGVMLIALGGKILLSGLGVL